MYLLFFCTVILLAYSPGPNVVLMINNGIKFHIKDALFAIPGTILALFFFAAISTFCVQGIFTISQSSFDILKIVGALYLVYIGLKSIFSKKSLSFNVKLETDKPKRKILFQEAFLCCITNPKVLFIYIALIPNFIISEGNVLTQNFFLCLIQMFVTALSMFTYIMIAGKAAHLFAKKINLVSYISGTVMILFAISILLSK